MTLTTSQQLEPEENSTRAGDHKNTDGFAEGSSSLPPVSAVPQPSQPPPSKRPPVTDTNKWWQDRKFVLELLGFAVLFAYTWFACLQWLQTQYANRLTARALDGSDHTLSETLKKMQAQSDATNNLYREAQKQAASAATMAINSGTQSTASVQSAHAATNAAKTAVETLHMTEHAYVVIDEPTIDLQQKAVWLPIFNIGHLASGEVEIVVHQAIASVTDILSPVPISNATGIWQRHRFQSAIPGEHPTIFVPFATLRPEELNSGHQVIYISGTVTANDGFPDTPPQRSTFCFSTKFIPVSSHVEFTLCGAPEMLPLLQRIDGYPDNESK